MSSLQQQYGELAALLQVHLLQEYPQGTWIGVEPNNYAYFKEHATQQRARQAPPPPAVAAAAPPRIPEPRAPARPANPPTPPTPVAPPPAVAAVPAPKKPEPAPEKQPQQAKPRFALEPPAEVPHGDLGEIRSLIAERFPNVRIIDEIPDDAEAQRIRYAWKGEGSSPLAIIGSFGGTAQEQTLLTNIVAAIRRYYSSDAIAQAGGWEKLLKIPNLANYLKDPKLKPALWTTVRTLLEKK